MKRVAIVTNFLGFDEAFSLCRVVANQVKMLCKAGYTPRVIVREGFENKAGGFPDGATWWTVDPGPQSQINEAGTKHSVILTEASGDEIDSLTDQLRLALAGYDVVLTHDLIYHAGYWKHHVACRRLALELPELRWIHWVHSATPLAPKHEIGEFRREIDANFGQFPHSKLVAFHEEEVERKAVQLNFPQDGVVIIPNPVDFTADFDEAARLAVDGFGRWPGLWDADAVGIYPCRLDRGKQPHVMLEVFAQLRQRRWDARCVVVDFHSGGGDKPVYRDEMKHWAWENGLPVLFTSDLPLDGAADSIPHKAVMDLVEFADVLVQPSVSETDSIVVLEAAWKRAGLLLNFDMPRFRLYQPYALFGKFSSNIDVTTGLAGQTITEYEDRDAYMSDVAASIAYRLRNDPALALHRQVRKERNLDAVWERMWEVIEGEW